jgi:hypothetical protein
MNTNNTDKSGLQGLQPRGDRSVEVGFGFCLQQNINSRVGVLAERHRLRGAKKKLQPVQGDHGLGKLVIWQSGNLKTKTRQRRRVRQLP